MRKFSFPVFLYIIIIIQVKIKKIHIFTPAEIFLYCILSLMQYGFRGFFQKIACKKNYSFLKPVHLSFKSSYDSIFRTFVISHKFFNVGVLNPLSICAI